MLLTVLAQVGHDDILSCCCVWKLHSYGQSKPAEQSMQSMHECDIVMLHVGIYTLSGRSNQ